MARIDGMETAGRMFTRRRRPQAASRRLEITRDFRVGRNRGLIVLTRGIGPVDSAPAMKRFLLLLLFTLSLAQPAAFAVLQPETAPPPASNAPTTADAETAANNTKAAAALQVRRSEPRPPDFLEFLVDSILERFDVRSEKSTTSHFVISGCLLVGALLLRRVVTGLIFGQLRKLASKTTTTLDDKLFDALEAPVGTAIVLVGVFAALKVLKLPEEPDRYIGYGSSVAFMLVIFWGLLRAFGALLDHSEEIARRKQLGIAAFMPWIKKTLVTIFVVFGILVMVQSFGFDVKALLAGLGLGGLAFALAAQDTIANLFGSIVVAIDQPFKIGEAVKIGGNEGVVEDIGLRSTKLRTPGKNLVIIPNKTVAAEAIINNSRFTRRRVEQVLGLTYDTKPDQMDGLVKEIRGLLTSDPEIDQGSVLVFFRDLSASSLDIWIAYETPNPDFGKHMAVKERMNLAFMRLVEARGLSFAFPTQTLHVATPLGLPSPEPKT
jgi:MscS family membrane protein